MKQSCKKKIYILTTIFLGLLLSFVLHASAETLYLSYAAANDIKINASYFFGFGWCALPWWTQYTFLILGIGGGYFLGQYWWKIVYIEKRHWKFKGKK